MVSSLSQNQDKVTSNTAAKLFPLFHHWTYNTSTFCWHTYEIAFPHTAGKKEAHSISIEKMMEEITEMQLAAADANSFFGDSLGSKLLLIDLDLLAQKTVILETLDHYG